MCKRVHRCARGRGECAQLCKAFRRVPPTQISGTPPPSRPSHPSHRRTLICMLICTLICMLICTRIARSSVRGWGGGLKNGGLYGVSMGGGPQKWGSQNGGCLWGEGARNGASMGWGSQKWGGGPKMGVPKMGTPWGEGARNGVSGEGGPQKWGSQNGGPYWVGVLKMGDPYGVGVPMGWRCQKWGS